jgi:hypothetical protein
LDGPAAISRAVAVGLDGTRVAATKRGETSSKEKLG